MKTSIHSLFTSTLRLTTLLICVLVTTTATSQQYLNLKQDGRIYDVDVVVFARQLTQPDADTISNKSPIKSADTKVLEPWDGQQKLLQYPDSTGNNSGDDSEWQVPIEQQAGPVKVLTDVILSTSMNHPVVNKLQANPSYQVILRQKWRQAPSSFRQPRYIQVSNVNTQDTYSDSYNDSGLNMGFGTVYPDYSIDGQMAFSRQKFMHLHVKMNLFRTDSYEQQITHHMSQQKRIELDKWQYFDHPQFGVLAKVTAIKLNQGD